MNIGKKVILTDGLIKNYNLSQRQGMMIEHILENGKMFPKDFERLYIKHKINSKITKRTLQRDLKDMIDKKIIKAKGATHKICYVLGTRLS